MDKKIVKFDDTEIEKYKFHQNKIPILIKNININKIVISNKIFSDKNSFKYFLGYNDAKRFIRRDFDKTKYLSFLIKDNDER